MQIILPYLDIKVFWSFLDILAMLSFKKSKLSDR